MSDETARLKAMVLAANFQLSVLHRRCQIAESQVAKLTKALDHYTTMAAWFGERDVEPPEGVTGRLRIVGYYNPHTGVLHRLKFGAAVAGDWRPIYVADAELPPGGKPDDPN